MQQLGAYLPRIRLPTRPILALRLTSGEQARSGRLLKYATSL